MSERQRFVLVSTGQNVANLPPVLEFANPGDEVIWIESEEAFNGNWAEGIKSILKRHGFEQNQIVRVKDINDPSEIVRMLKNGSASHVIPQSRHGGESALVHSRLPRDSYSAAADLSWRRDFWEEKVRAFRVIASRFLSDSV